MIYLLNLFFAAFEGWQGQTSLAISLISNAVEFASAILLIIWGFQFRSRLHTLRNAVPKASEWLNPVLTFLFGSMYLQYRINLAIDRDRGKVA